MTPPDPNNQTNKLAYIDMLRGIAVLMVVLVHTSQKIHHLSPLAALLGMFGQFGVQMFFVASAYTLCLSSDRRRNESSLLSAFYIRRFFRIAPLYYVGIIIYFAIHMATRSIPADGVVSPEIYTPSNILANVLFIHGLIPHANNNIVSGGWSIGTEMLFYAVFPALFALSKRLVEKTGVGMGMLPILSIAILGNLALQLAFCGTEIGIRNNSFLYYSIFNQLPVFLVGMGAYFLVRQNPSGTIFQGRWILLLGSLLFAAATKFLWDFRIPLLFTIIPVTAAISFSFLLLWLKSADWRPRWLVRIGQVSYSIYVFHFIFAWHVMPLFTRPLAGRVNSDLILLASFLAVVAATFSVSCLTEKFIEKKGIAVGAKVVSHLQKTESLY